MKDIALTFKPDYPGSNMERAFLGSVQVGRIEINAGRVWWLFLLPSTTGQQSPYWTPCKTKQEAQSALMNATQGWLKMAGLSE